MTLGSAEGSLIVLQESLSISSKSHLTWGVQRVAVLDLAVRVGAAEGEEFLGHQPVEVSVLHFLVVFVLIVVEVVKVEET